MGIPLVLKYRVVREELPRDQEHLLRAYRDARSLAFSVAQQLPGHGFDVVDVPDYPQHGVFIRAALEAEGLHCGIVALSLHGTLSSALASGWPAPGTAAIELDEMRIREELQFRVADARYAISAAYAREWEEKALLPVNLVDPLSIVANLDPVLPVPREGPPDLVFVGRREKWEGPRSLPGLGLVRGTEPVPAAGHGGTGSGSIASAWAPTGFSLAWRVCAACSPRSWVGWHGSRCSACWPSAPCCCCRLARIRSTSLRSRRWRVAVRH